MSLDLSGIMCACRELGRDVCLLGKHSLAVLKGRGSPPLRSAAGCHARRAARARRDSVPATLTVASDPAEPVAVGSGQGRAVFVSPYTGEPLGGGATGKRACLRTVTDVHRWLGASGEARSKGRAVTGACKMAFLLLVLSGLYLWLPRAWTRATSRGSGEGLAARCATSIDLVPVGQRPRLPRRRRDAATAARAPARRGRAAALRRSRRASTHPSRALSAKSPARSACSGRPRRTRPYSSTSTTEPAASRRGVRSSRSTARRAVRELGPFSSGSTGRRLRSVLRFAHTGEVLGPVGQSVAGLAQAGAALLVFTGLALNVEAISTVNRKLVVRKLAPRFVA